MWASSTCEIRISTNTLGSKSMTERKQRAKNERQRKRIKGTEEWDKRGKRMGISKGIGIDKRINFSFCFQTRHVPIHNLMA